MALSDDIQAELELDGLYFDTGELAQIYEIGISDGIGGTLRLQLTVVWDEDVLSQHTLAANPNSVFLSDIRVQIRAIDLPRRPVSQEDLYARRLFPLPVQFESHKYKVSKCIENLGVYEITLVDVEA